MVTSIKVFNNRMNSSVSDRLVQLLTEKHKLCCRLNKIFCLMNLTEAKKISKENILNLETKHLHDHKLSLFFFFYSVSFCL